MAVEYEVSEEWRPAQKHSGAGIASFVIASLTGAFMLVLVAIAGIVEVSTPGGMDEQSAVAFTVGLSLFAGCFGALLGGILGVVGLAQRDRKKVFAVLGLVLNAAIILGVLLLLAIGIAAQAAGG